MAKFKAKTEIQKEDYESWTNKFPGLKTESGWSISHNKVSDRLELRNESGVQFSSVDVNSCRSIAEERYNIAQTEWK